jgi:membrane-bound lytic murein transglycosylase B
MRLGEVVLMRAMIVVAMFALLASPAAAQVGDPMRSQSPTVDADFQAWISAFRARAQSEGVRAETIENALDGIAFSPRVVALDRSQPDDSRPTSVPRFSSYLAGRLTPGRIAPGRRLARDLDATMRAIDTRFGVGPAIVLGIWGMESGYGAVTGSFDLVRSLASLAFDGRREALFTGELVAALKLLDRGVITRSQLTGSWAGATGNPQFLPSSYLSYAVDFDADGKADIWQSRPDTAASIANYLRSHGWLAGGDWAMRVSVPANLDRERVRNLVQPTECVRVLGKHSRWIPVREWRQLGFSPLDGRRWPSDDVLASLVEPDGQGGGGYLTYGNYRALLKYNCSNFYALSVGLLADAIAAPIADDYTVPGGVRGRP